MSEVNASLPEDKELNQPTPEPKDDNMVPKEVFDRFKSDTIKYKSKAKQLEDELNSLKEAKLKDAQNWQELAKLKEQEAEEYRQKYAGLNETLVRNSKISAIRTEALKQGLHSSALNDLDLLDMSEIMVETTSQGRMFVNGADRFVHSLKQTRPHWFTSQAPGVNPQSPTTHKPQSGKTSLKDVEVAQAEYQKDSRNKTKEAAYKDAIYKYKNGL